MIYTVIDDFVHMNQFQLILWMRSVNFSFCSNILSSVIGLFYWRFWSKKDVWLFNRKNRYFLTQLLIFHTDDFVPIQALEELQMPVTQHICRKITGYLFLDTSWKNITQFFGLFDNMPPKPRTPTIDCKLGVIRRLLSAQKSAKISKHGSLEKKVRHHCSRKEAFHYWPYHWKVFSTPDVFHIIMLYNGWQTLIAVLYTVRGLVVGHRIWAAAL